MGGWKTGDQGPGARATGSRGVVNRNWWKTRALMENTGADAKHGVLLKNTGEPLFRLTRSFPH